MLPVRKQISIIQQKIFDANSSKRFIDYTDVGELTSEVRIALQQICVDLGIRAQLEDSTVIRIIKYLLDYFGLLSVADLMNAFEFLIIGKLDSHLPKTKGKVEKEHYQQLSVEYLTRILNAYKQFKQGQVSEAPVALLPEKIVSEAEKKHFHDKYLNDLIKWADEDKMEPTFLLLGTEFNYDLFIKWGLVPEKGKEFLIHKKPMKKQEVALNRIELNPVLSNSFSFQFEKYIKEAIQKLHSEGKTLKQIISQYED